MRLYGSVANQRLLLGESRYAWCITVFIVGSEQIVYLRLVTIAQTLILYLADKIEVIDALQRLSVDIILLLCALELFEGEDLNLRGLEIEELVRVVAHQLVLFNRDRSLYHRCASHQIHCHCIHNCNVLYDY